jgi:hypothetical protein
MMHAIFEMYGAGSLVFSAAFLTFGWARGRRFGL